MLRKTFAFACLHQRKAANHLRTAFAVSTLHIFAFAFLFCDPLFYLCNYSIFKSNKAFFVHKPPRNKQRKYNFKKYNC